MSFGTNPAFAQAGPTVTLAASTTSASAALPPGGDTLVVTNPTTSLAWVTFGAGTTPGAAVAGQGNPVLPGQHRVIGCGSLATWVAAILMTGSGPIYVETGTGSAT